MAAAFLKPGCIKGSGQLDDQYLALVQRPGDTTDATAQVATLQSLGLHARFRTDGRIEHLVEQINRRVPYPVGGLHKGSASAPSGGGHWSLVISGYVRTAIGSGQALRYSERNWGRRWQVEGSGSGWWIQISTHQ